MLNGTKAQTLQNTANGEGHVFGADVGIGVSMLCILYLKNQMVISTKFSWM